MARPRGHIEDYNPRQKTRDLLAQVEDVLAAYQDELPLTARQIFYRLVGSAGYPKDENAYGRLTEHLGNFRQAVESKLDMDLLDKAKSGEAGNREEFEQMMRRLRDEDAD
jgi:hypothetical protein